MYKPSDFLGYLKSSLSRELPQDRISANRQYGRLRDNIKHLYPSVLKYWKIGAVSFVCIIAVALLAFPMPLVSKYLIDNVLVAKNLQLLVPVLLLYLIIIVLNKAFSILQTYTNTIYTQQITLDIQSRLLNSVFALPKSFFDHIHRGYLMTRLTGDVGSVQWFISGTLAQMVVQVIRFFGGIFFLFYLEWRIALPLLLFLPVPFFVARYFGKISYVMSHKTTERRAAYNSVFQEIISSIPLVKTFSKEKASEEKIVEEMKKNNKLALQQQALGIFNGFVMGATPKLANAFVVAFGAYWVITDQWTIGSLWAFRSYFGYVLGPISFLASSMNQLQTHRAALERLASLFEMAPEENTESGIIPKKLEGEVEFRNATFGYEPGKDVINNLSFKAEKGEKWAIIGPSGIGKTTLVSLLMRFYKPRSGEIFFDGLEASEYNVRELRKRMGYVLQKTELFSGTIEDNIRFSNDDATIEEIETAAQIADIHSFIETLPDKYATVLDESGSNLSEGQRQRLSIARALVRNPDILIFDEPTASLDSATEQNIYSMLDKHIKNKTVFTIAHRLNTVRNSDRVIFLRESQKALIGSHNELMQHSEYRKFFEEYEGFAN